jgi:DNA-binding MarR family transcriptional regulator
MSFSPKPSQTLLLWSLLAEAGEAWQRDLKPAVDAKDRRALEQAGLVTSETRKNGKSRAIWLAVTDAGWSFANDHLSEPLPEKTQGAAPVLQKWLTRLQAFMQTRGVALAAIIGNADQPRTPPRSDLRDRIRSAYLDASGGAFSTRVRLCDLRARLVDVSRDTLDAALLDMLSNNNIMLYALDNRREITTADEQAAMAVGGDTKHLLYLTR